ncbi:helix-turn-helix domain-containing protein [Phocaeicola plebeius]
MQDVAEKLCFSDQASFSKFFKRYCGMSPGQFKKQA